MYVDARALPDGERLDADLCIVGAGAAGITLAREFVGTGVRVCLVESGGFEAEGDTQDLYDGDVVGTESWPLTTARLRYFGGSTNHWNGFCRPLDPCDFMVRDYLPGSGWPFDSEHMRPYYRRAHTVCELGPLDYSAERWADGAVRPFAFRGRSLTSAIFQYSPPTRFGEVYRTALGDAPNVTVLLHANAVDIETPDVPDRVTAVAVATLDGRRLRITARDHVLATGGIENPRLLLNADRVQAGGLGNGNGLVGRCFGDHPIVWRAGLAVFPTAVPEIRFYGNDRAVGGRRVRGVIVPTRAALDRACMPNWAITLQEARLVDASEGARSLKHLMRQLDAGELPGEVGRHLLNIAADLDVLAESAWQRVAGTPLRLFTTRYFCECPPDPESRVRLTDRRDPLGLRRVALDWRMPADFYRHLATAHRLLAEELGGLGVARLQVFPEHAAEWPTVTFESSYHHMGTTRMHVDPRQGVVDADARVHGIANLYVAGSSVFPTYGYANPTVTIAAMTIRLADHLKGKTRDL